MKESDYSRQRALSKREAMDTVLQLVVDGMKPHQAIRSLGRSVSCYEKWRQDHPDWAQKITNIRLGREDPTLTGMPFVQFRSTYFDRSTPQHHYQIIEAMERAQPDSVTLVLAFPESAKSSLYLDRICHRLGVNPSTRMALISEGQDLARKLVRQVANRMTDRGQFDPYITRFGPFRAPDRDLSRPWNADYLVHMQAQLDEKDYSLEARGAGSTLYGGRFDEICLDDIQSDKNLAMTGTLLTYIRQTVLTRPAKGVGRTFILGSRVGERDIYRALMDEEIVDQVITIPALDRHISRDEHFTKVRGKVVANPGCPAQSNWPEYWTLQDLAVRRDKVGEEIWARTYMQHSVVASGATFTEEMIENAKDHDRTIGPMLGGTERIGMCDPALDSGTAAFLVASVSPQKMHLIDGRQRADIYRSEDIISQIADYTMAYRPTRWIIEENNYQKALVRDERLHRLAAKFGFEIQPHQTHRNKNDPLMGVKMMASAFSDGEISIPWGDDQTRILMGPLVDELRNWRPGMRGSVLKQDSVMALWFGWLWWEANRQAYHSPPRSWRPSFVRAG